MIRYYLMKYPQEIYEIPICPIDDSCFFNDFELGIEQSPNDSYCIDLPMKSSYSLQNDIDTSISSQLLNKCIKKVPIIKPIRKSIANRKLIKQIQNRISAQKSRDRKKQELENLKTQIEILRQENITLKYQLQSAINNTESLRQIHSDCNTIYEKESFDEIERNKSEILISALLFSYFCISKYKNPSKICYININDTKGHKDLTPAQKARREYIERKNLEN